MADRFKKAPRNSAGLNCAVENPRLGLGFFIGSTDASDKKTPFDIE